MFNLDKFIADSVTFRPVSMEGLCHWWRRFYRFKFH